MNTGEWANCRGKKTTTTTKGRKVREEKIGKDEPRAKLEGGGQQMRFCVGKEDSKRIPWKYHSNWTRRLEQ